MFAAPSARTTTRADEPGVSTRLSMLGAALAIALMTVQVAAIRFSPSAAPLRVILPLTIALVPVALWPHRGRLGVWVIFVGMLANLTVIVANGGLMPIEQRTVVEAVGSKRAAAHPPGHWLEGSKDVVVGPGSGRLVALGDGIVIRTGGRGVAASPGDLVVWAGILIVAGEMSVTWQRRARSRGSGKAILPRAEGSATTAR